MKEYECEDCKNTAEFTIIKILNIWREDDNGHYSEDVMEVVICGKCKSFNVKTTK